MLCEDCNMQLWCSVCGNLYVLNGMPLCWLVVGNAYDCFGLELVALFCSPALCLNLPVQISRIGLGILETTKAGFFSKKQLSSFRLDVGTT